MIEKISDIKDYIKYIKEKHFKIDKGYLFSLVNRFSKFKTITYLCEIAEVSRSGYYKWKKRDKTDNNKFKLIKEIKKIQKSNNYNLGYRRVYKILKKNNKTDYSQSTIYRVMRKYGLLSNAHYNKKIFLLIVLYINIKIS